MARVWQLQTSLNRGELDPRLVGRRDLEAYYAGAKQCKNVTTLVQGGVKRRNGTRYVHTSTDGRLFNFSFSTEVNYALLFTDLKLEIFKEGVLQTNINGSGDDFLVTTYTLAEVKDLDYIQAADTAILAQGNHSPAKLERTSDTAWTITTATLFNIPQYDFNDSLSPTPVSEVQALAIFSHTEGDRFKLSLEGILTDEIVFSGNQTTMRNSMADALVALPNTGGEGSITVTSSDISNYVFTLSGDSAKNWDLISLSPIQSVDVNLRGNFTQTTPGVARSEAVWSATRGWPQVTTFHEGRLYFGRTDSRPQTVWGSKVNFFFDFNEGKGRDDEGIDVTLDTDQINAITGLFSNRNLQIFTTGGEFSVPTSPVTPANIAVIQQTNFGSKKIRPVTIDGITLFIQRTGKAIRDFVFLDSAKAYNSNSISVLASHLIGDPIDIAVSRGTTDVDANYAYFLNSDGTMAVYNSLLAEDVRGFSEWVTEGSIKSISVVDDELYTYVKRTVGGADVYMLEIEDKDLTTDSSSVASSTDTLTGLSHLNGETIEVIADGAFQGEFVVSGGQVTIDHTATLITGGLNFVPVIETMPLNTGLQNGPNAALPKRVVRVGLELFESNGVLVNGQRLADKTLGVDVFEAPIPQTGLKRIFLQGWDVEATVTITQVEPMPLTLLALYVEVSV